MPARNVNPYGLTGPCDACPFRTDKQFPLGVDRRQEIADSLMVEDTEFRCHKTLDYSDGEARVTSGSQVCGGALVVMAKADQGYPQMTRIAGRVGMFDPSRLDLDAPVPDDLDDWVADDPEAAGWR
jgi:hypothetical protein